MKAPRFWREPQPTLLARALQPLGALYGAATLHKMRRARADCGVPVICVGNYTAGGAGKTPVAIYAAQLLSALVWSVPAFEVPNHFWRVRISHSAIRWTLRTAVR